MTWDERLNNVFDYIEKHLAGNIDLDKVACIMHQSKESFLRTFSIITNISIYEYIRKRRMTLAALELQNNSVKIIDLAMKYGYESPEYFTRAFKVIHGISPSAARKKGVKLSLYPRISFLITVKGDIEMDYQMDVNNEQRVNLLGFNWDVMKSPDLKPVDNCFYLANKWRESNRINLLDLGTGLGRHAVYFSKQGFNVSAMDILEYAIDYLKNWAIKENLSINAEIGRLEKGIGIYSAWLAKQGNDVHLLELADTAITYAKEHMMMDCNFVAEVADARHINRTDSSADVVLLMGPLYHMQDVNDRKQTLLEAYRLLKDGGTLVVTGISKFSSTTWALSTYGNINNFIDDETFFEMLKGELTTGNHNRPKEYPYLIAESFFSTPKSFETELIETGFSVSNRHAVEGCIWFTPCLDEKWNNELSRKRLLEIIHMTEHENEIIGMSPHFLVVCKK